MLHKIAIKAFVVIEKKTIFIPFLIICLIGIFSNQPFGYYLIFFILSFTPAILGIPDPVGEIIDYIIREKKIQKNNLFEKRIVDKYGVNFLRLIHSQKAPELRLMADCIKNNSVGFNRENNDPSTKKLLESGLIYKSNGYTASGFPFYFYKRNWILMNGLQNEIFLAHDRIGKPSVTPKKPEPETFSLINFFIGIFLGLLRLIALLIIGISFGSITWLIWIFLMASVVAIMVWGGKFFGDFFGI